MRTKQNFDKDWMYITDEVGPIPKTYAKSGMLAGITNAVDGERFEPLCRRGENDESPAGYSAGGGGSQG